MNRVYNFAAGPACLPEAVLKKAQAELPNYRESGMSVMEMSHRSAIYQDIIDRAEASLRSLMQIPENYHVLFLQGGASLQFTMVPMNLMTRFHRAHYVNTGSFSSNAIKEARRFGEVNIAASSEDAKFTCIPELSADLFDEDADYVHITQNNTIYGTHYSSTPPVGSLPLVSDMSSCILSEEINVSDYGIIYAGAQKNIGPAGVTVVIIRDDLLGRAQNLPSMLDYAVMAKNGSMFNTPPTYGIYMAGLVFDHLLENGGIRAMHEKNVRKAAKLYDCIENSGLFQSPVVKKDRSIMNVPFITGDKELDAAFVSGATKAGLLNLKGHRSVGGMRASIYNAMPEEGVEALIAYMKQFEAERR